MSGGPTTDKAAPAAAAATFGAAPESLPVPNSGGGAVSTTEPIEIPAVAETAAAVAEPAPGPGQGAIKAAAAAEPDAAPAGANEVRPPA